VCGYTGSRGVVGTHSRRSVKVDTDATLATADQVGPAAAGDGGTTGSKLHAAIVASVAASPQKLATTIRGFWNSSAGPAANSVLGEHCYYNITLQSRYNILSPLLLLYFDMSK